MNIKSFHDEKWMAVAIRLSRHHKGLTGKNPCVAALVVQNDQVVGRGITGIGGRPHAETQALDEAGALAKGSTVYVTLEPCAHYGQTPPCVEALIKANVSRVVLGVRDPDLRVHGLGVECLQKAGILVEENVLSIQVKRELKEYLLVQSRKRPFVRLKTAFFSNGVVGVKSGKQKVISGNIAQRQTHILRSQSDAILVGIGTILNDNPFLTCRLPGLEQRSPIRIILDRDLKIPLESNVLESNLPSETWIVSNAACNAKKRKFLEQKGINFLLKETTGLIVLQDLLKNLFKLDITNLLVEGGELLASQFLKNNLVDEWIQIKSKRSFCDENSFKILGWDKVADDGWLLEEALQYGQDFWQIWRKND